MNKFKINILVLWAIILLVSGISSCKKDFLDEELKTQRNTDYFKTPEGISDLADALYNHYRAFFMNREQAVATNACGTDEFIVGGDQAQQTWNDYNSNLGSIVPNVPTANVTKTYEIWDMMYKAISDANVLLANVDEVITDAGKNKLFKAEASFLRAFSYFRLVQQYGPVVLKLEPSTGVERYFIRATKEECVNQIIADLRTAYAGLPDVEESEGKLYKDVAAHFLAKALLYRCSEINDDWNASYKTTDLAEIITLTNEVIAHHPLATDFSDIFAYTGSDGPNEMLPEVIFAAQFSSTTTIADVGNGNYLHLLFLSVYQTLTGFVRDIAGGREYQRCRTNDYTFDVFDIENDSRFWKSFKTKANLNNISNLAQLNGTDPNTSVEVTYAQGDLGLIYIINKEGDTRFSNPAAGGTPLVKSTHSGVYFNNPVTGKPTPHSYARYLADGSGYLRLPGNVSRYPALSKYLDGSRTAVAATAGRRDGIYARVAETYLIKAEALIRQNNYTEAISVMNIVRERAQFRDGEDRAAYRDGGAAVLTNSNAPLNANGVLINSNSNANSYYESLDIPVTTAATDITTGITPASLPAVDEAIITKLGLSGDYDRMMCFLLNERSRELYGELFRWEDLARTKTLLSRALTFNEGTAGANAIREKHYLRPLPQTFLDAIYNAEGRALTADEKAAMQNPGY
ncbi:MAG: RagB/SusD family nutrient uptake outer membrane protein [Bacteroidales bacterium]|nr:RagB/SusD family nutrient uptake outer membrane protein [Bacteroidales bacterium]